MWIAIGVIIALAIIFAILWILDPRSERLPSEVRKFQYWLDKHRSKLPDDAAKRLEESIRTVNEIYEKRMDRSFIFYGTCCRVELRDAYEDLFRVHYEIYRKHIDKNATKDEAYKALDDVTLRKFSTGQSVYVPKLDFHGIIQSVNDDDTYTVCDVAERCHRVKENEIIPKEEGKDLE